MQSNKASKKTRTIAAEPATPSPETSAAVEVTAKPRTSRSSKTKKAESELGSVKHHHKVNASTPPENMPAASTPATMAAAAGIAASGVAPSAAGIIATVATPVTHQEIAALAHSYWVARGYAHGSAEEDWLRAERELNAKS